VNTSGGNPVGSSGISTVGGNQGTQGASGVVSQQTQCVGEWTGLTKEQKIDWGLFSGANPSYKISYQPVGDHNAVKLKDLKYQDGRPAFRDTSNLCDTFVVYVKVTEQGKVADNVSGIINIMNNTGKYIGVSGFTFDGRDIMTDWKQQKYMMTLGNLFNNKTLSDYNINTPEIKNLPVYFNNFAPFSRASVDDRECINSYKKLYNCLSGGKAKGELGATPESEKQINCGSLEQVTKTKLTAFICTTRGKGAGSYWQRLGVRKEVLEKVMEDASLSDEMPSLYNLLQLNPWRESTKGTVLQKLQRESVNETINTLLKEAISKKKDQKIKNIIRKNILK
jgi:hypothetical protein